jgi:hypothetical protein
VTYLENVNIPSSPVRWYDGFMTRIVSKSDGGYPRIFINGAPAASTFSRGVLLGRRRSIFSPGRHLNGVGFVA